MAGHPARDRSVRCAASQSGRATYEISRRSSSTAVTSATSITPKSLSSHFNIMRWHHDNPPTFRNISRKWVSGPKRRDCESSGWPLLKFSVHTGVGLVAASASIETVRLGGGRQSFDELMAEADHLVRAHIAAHHTVGQPGPKMRPHSARSCSSC